MTFELPKLSYEYDALEPYIDKETMELHHTKHHAAYTQKFNEAIKSIKECEGLPAEKILRNIETIIPENIRTSVRNNGGGYVNHKIFWTILSKNGGEATETLKKEIDLSFTSIEEFKARFNKHAMARFGSGWVWLVINKEKKLEIDNMPNQDSPYMLGKTPILGLDVWEHAYYLKYQNRRPEYIEAFWNIINWKEVSRRYEEAIQM